MQKNYKYDVSVEMFTPSSQTIMDKLKILSDAAKFDVSCSSSGVSRKGNGRDMGELYISRNLPQFCSRWKMYLTIEDSAVQ